MNGPATPIALPDFRDGETTLEAVAYGIAAEFRPSVTAGYGAAFVIGTATLLDEGVIPAVGLGSPPWRPDLATNLYSYASHLVFGEVGEFVRRQVAGPLSK